MSNGMTKEECLKTEHLTENSTCFYGTSKFYGVGRYPKKGSKIWIGEETAQVVLHVDQYFNWFQKKMWKFFFGFKIEEINEE